MMLIGIDDTDIVGSPGTNQLARQIVRELAGEWRCVHIIRHQLLDDPRVPYTSKNGSASIALERRSESVETAEAACATSLEVDALLACCRRMMREWFILGSDPGLCLLPGTCPAEVVAWGQRCQREFVSRNDAYAIAAKVGVHLEALGGTEDGVIGALAAVGLASTQNDGRVIQLGEWSDDLSGLQTVDQLGQRGVRVREYATGTEFTHGEFDVGKRLRPNMREGVPVLFVAPGDHQVTETYRALKMP